jgi:hypothetical protein
VRSALQHGEVGAGGRHACAEGKKWNGVDRESQLVVEVPTKPE